MTMALAVAMVACSGAAGTPGPAGPPGKDAPTPDPTTPTTPTTPTEPTTDNAAPMLEMAFKPVYLTVKGAGMKMYTPKLSEHITDADSVLRFALTSSAATIASVEEKSGAWTIKAVKAGSATITVMAHDGANAPLSTTIAVTVVKENKAPTSRGLSGSDRKELEKTLYIVDGARTDTITIKTDAGEDDDAIVDYKYMVGKDDKGKDDNVTVAVTKGSGNTHVVVVTPKDSTSGVKALGAPDQTVKIYPKDKFGAVAMKAWTFKAKFNKPPKVLTDSFSIELLRDAVAIDHDAASPPNNAARIEIGEYFQVASLQRIVDPDDTDTNTALNSATDIDLVGDTVCAISYSPTSLAIVKSLNEESVLSGEYTKEQYVTGDQAIEAIVIDSRFTSYGADMVALASGVADDTPAKGEGTVTVTITCTDKDASVVVTGKVVVRAA